MSEFPRLLRRAGACAAAAVVLSATLPASAQASRTALLSGLTPALSVVTGIAVLAVLVSLAGVVKPRRSAEIAVDEAELALATK